MQATLIPHIFSVTDACRRTRRTLLLIPHPSEVAHDILILMGPITRSLVLVVLLFIGSLAFIEYGSDFLWSLSTFNYLVTGAVLLAIGVGLIFLSIRIHKGENTTLITLGLIVAVLGVMLFVAPLQKALVNRCFETGGVELDQAGSRVVTCIDSSGKTVD